MEISIFEKHHVSKAKRQVTELAKKLGFSEIAIGEIAIVVTELAENIIKHGAIEGKIVFSEIKKGKRRGIEIISEDKGPGIAKIETVMEDGFSTTGSLGIGLGAVKRLMSEFDIKSSQNLSGKGGTKIITKKYLPPKGELKNLMKKSTIFSIFSRSKLGEIENGDSYFLQHFESNTMIAVIDGLGHGNAAAEASRKAKQLLYENFKEDLEVIILALNQNLRHTRGVAISIALINDQEKTLEYVGIGNVLGRVYNSPEPIKLVNYNGTLGVSLRKFKVFKYPWQVGNLIILTSDGISNKYDFEDFSNLLHNHPIVIANTLFKKFNKKHDDATILVGGPG
ncbi:MAG: ATP-binding SpoIIE family protein phosphatase [Candidatus Hodarchaeota archaeon]